MNQHYLDIARLYADDHPIHGGEAPDQGPFASAELRIDGSDLEVTENAPIPLEAYQAQSARRCRECGYGMSIIAISDLCGRCAAKPNLPPNQYGPTPPSAKSWSEADVLRMHVLVVGDRLRYPSLRLNQAHTIAAGIEGWGPFLREASLEQLEDILKKLARVAPLRKEADDEHPVLID